MISIIPAIDIIDGRCVRLTKGEYNTKKIYNEDPLEVAKQFEDTGFKKLHLVDLDGAKAGNVVNWKTLNDITAATSLQVDFSGGISKDEDVTSAFSYGATWVSIGSMAVKDDEKFISWIRKYGAEKFQLGADVKDELIALKGWTETSSITVYDLIEKYLQHGITNVFCTDISKDGMMQGPAIDLYTTIKTRFPGIQLIASGGVSSIGDVDALAQIGCTGVIIGKAFYEGLITPIELKKYVN